MRNMGSHTMKTTIGISDDLFAHTQEVARKEKTTFRSLTERGLRLVLAETLTGLGVVRENVTD